MAVVDLLVLLDLQDLLEQLELLQTDSESDSDDDALFEDAQSLFSSIPEEYSDEEEMRPRADSFRGGPKPRLDGGGGAEAPAFLSGFAPRAARAQEEGQAKARQGGAAAAAAGPAAYPGLRAGRLLLAVVVGIGGLVLAGEQGLEPAWQQNW